MVKLLGIIGGCLFAYCGVPSAWATFKAKCSIGVPITTAWMIVGGGVCMYSYMTLTYGLDWVLTINYAVEVASWAVIVRYHYFPRPLSAIVRSIKKEDYESVSAIQGAILKTEKLPAAVFGPDVAFSEELPVLNFPSVQSAESLGLCKYGCGCSENTAKLGFMYSPECDCDCHLEGIGR